VGLAGSAAMGLLLAGSAARPDRANRHTPPLALAGFTATVPRRSLSAIVTSSAPPCAAREGERRRGILALSWASHSTGSNSYVKQKREERRAVAGGAAQRVAVGAPHPTHHRRR
jgi:hypothetical protein